jgi:hypothetical protein
MLFDPGVIEPDIYTVLTADATLSDLLAVDNLPNGYQQGVYAHISPETDPVSRKPPRFPLIVFTREGSFGADQITIGKTRVVSTPYYRINVYGMSSGAMSMVQVQSIANRVAELLDGRYVTSTNPCILYKRESTDMVYEDQSGGRVVFCATLLYKITAQVIS